MQAGHGQQCLAQSGCLVNAVDSLSPPLTVLSFHSHYARILGFWVSSLLAFLPLTQ